MKLTIAAAILFQLISVATIPVDAKQEIRRRAKDGKKGKKDKKCKSAKECKMGDKSEGTLTARLGPYPSTGESVQGDVKVKFNHDGSLTLNAEFIGVQSNCVECGIHIHPGTSCETSDQVGGHYWNAEEGFEDPWFAEDGAYYNSDKDGLGTAEFSVTTGFGFNCNVGRTMVVHAANGDRVGCGVLSAGKCCKKLKATIAGYPGYTGSEKVTGDVYVDFDDNKDLTMTADLGGTSLICNNTEGDSKCRIHIHAGLTCVNKDLVGGHYWDKFAPVLDPWFPNDPYNTVYDANGAVDFTVTNGYDCSNNVGHAVVVHEVTNGGRIGCGVLEEVVE